MADGCVLSVGHTFGFTPASTRGFRSSNTAGASATVIARTALRCPGPSTVPGVASKSTYGWPWAS